MFSAKLVSSGYAGLSQSSGASVRQLRSPYHTVAGFAGGKSTRPVLLREVFFSAPQLKNSRGVLVTKFQLLYGLRLSPVQYGQPLLCAPPVVETAFHSTRPIGPR